MAVVVAIQARQLVLVLNQCDHHTLNDFMDNPTAENLVLWMWQKLKDAMGDLSELKLWETPEYCVTYRGG